MTQTEHHCIDLRPWANANRCLWRYEDGHTGAEADAEWFVEVLCRHGLIYPKGGNVLLAYCNRGVKRRVAKIDGAQHHQHDDNAEVFRFPAELLDQVAAILRPKRLRGSATLTERQRETLKRHAFKGGQEAPGLTQP